MLLGIERLYRRDSRDGTVNKRCSRGTRSAFGGEAGTCEALRKRLNDHEEWHSGEDDQRQRPGPHKGQNQAREESRRVLDDNTDGQRRSHADFVGFPGM